MKAIKILTDLMNDSSLEPYEHNQISAAIEAFKEQLVEHSKIASRALLIGEEEGWFEWKEKNDGSYISPKK